MRHGLASALMLAAAVAVPTTPRTHLLRASGPELPKSAHGNGPRSTRCRSNPTFDRAKANRTRKLARQAKRRNRR